MLLSGEKNDSTELEFKTTIGLHQSSPASKLTGNEEGDCSGCCDGS